MVTPISLGANAVEVSLTANVQPTVGNSGRCVAGVVQVTDTEHIQLRPGGDDIALATTREVDSLVGSYHSAWHGRDSRQPFGEHLLTVRQTPAVAHIRTVGPIRTLLDRDRRADPRLVPLGP